jgi:hypothetical protein
MIFVNYVTHDDTGLLTADADHVVKAIVGASILDRRDLLSLLRARICLSCAEPRTGTFTECPMCRISYPKEP